MSRIAKPHRILAMAVVAALAAAAPAAADGPNRLPTTFVAPTCSGPNEIVECAPPAKHRYSAADDVVAPTCGGPNEIVECAPPVKSHPDSPIDDEAQPTCGGPGDVIECPPPVESEPRDGKPVRQA
jgi:hypothetical protein